MAQHVVEAAGPPTEAPPSQGAHYIDTNTGEIYLANGTASVDDWLLGGGGGASGGKIYHNVSSDDANEGQIVFSEDGGRSFKETSEFPDSVGFALGAQVVQAVGNIIVNSGT